MVSVGVTKPPSLRAWLALIAALLTVGLLAGWLWHCLLYTSPSPRDS